MGNVNYCSSQNNPNPSNQGPRNKGPLQHPAPTPKRSNVVVATNRISAQHDDDGDDDAELEDEEEEERRSSHSRLTVSVNSSPNSYSEKSFVSVLENESRAPKTDGADLKDHYQDDDDDEDESSTAESTTCSPLLLSFATSSRRAKLNLIGPPPPPSPPLLSVPSPLWTTTMTTITNNKYRHRSFSSFCSFDQVQEDAKDDICFMMNNSRSLSYNNFIEMEQPYDDALLPISTTHHHHRHPLLDPSSPWTTTTGNNDPTTTTTQQEDWLPTEDSDLRPNEQRVRQFWIVTTAALPWMTGTAVNPLLRAAYLSQLNRPFVATTTNNSDNNNNSTFTSTVTLVLPWLFQAEDRVALYGPEWQQATSQDQEAYIRDWLAQKAKLPLEAHVETGGIVILWYPARYHAKLSSIFAMGDICSLLSNMTTATATSPPSSPERPPSSTLELSPPSTPSSQYATNSDDEAHHDFGMGDVCILEEPEHVNFYRAPGKLSWRHRFRHVVGIMHTNYKAYASHSYHGIVTAPIVGALSSWMVRAYCDRVIKLSPVLQEYASEKEVICNVHGIRQEFFGVGGSPPNMHHKKRAIYFLGKLLWAKGLDRLLELEAVYRKMTGDYFRIDIYGSGPEQEEIQRAFCGQPMKQQQQQAPSEQQSQATSQPAANSKSRTTSNLQRGKTSPSPSTPLPWYFYYHNHKKKIPARFMGRQDHAVLHDYKIFVNPSVTEVLCTTTAEAIAMGKLVIIPQHPSNIWFTQFPNCFQYQNPKEFVQFLQYAMMPSTIPAALSPQLLHMLSWEAATERFLQAASIRRLDAPRLRSTEALDHRLAQFHYELGKGVKGDVLRKVLGAGPVADQVQYMNEPTALAVA